MFYFILLQRVHTTAIKYFMQVILFYFTCFILLVRRHYTAVTRCIALTEKWPNNKTGNLGT